MSKRRDQFTGVPADFVRQLQAALARADERISALERDPGRDGIVLRSTSANAGQFLNIEAPADGLTILLPQATAALRNERVTLSFRNTNPVKIEAVRGTVNREPFVINTAIGTFEAIADGLGGWSVETGVSSSGSAVNARYVLGAAHASLPQAAVATDTTEIDVTVTPGGTATWALRDGSVVVERLENIPDQTALGNDTGVPDNPQPVTIHQELDWIPGVTGLAWIFSGSNIATMGDVLDVNPTDAWTLGIWVEASAFGGGEPIRKYDASGRGYAMQLTGSSKLRIYLGTTFVGSAGISVDSVASITAGKRFLVVGSSGNGLASGVDLWIDGVLQSKTVNNDALAGGATTNAQTLQIGVFSNTSTVTDAARWNVKLTTAQVLEAYASGAPPDLNLLATAPPPVGWWRFDSSDAVGAGNIADHSTSNFDATAGGGLAPTTIGSIGLIPVRGASVWTTVAPSTSGLALVGNGVNTLPTYRQIGTNGMPSYGVESFLGNFTGGSAVPTARAGTSVAGAGLTYTAGGTLAVGSSTSITVNADDIQRAALTGAITASVNSNATAFGVLAAKSVLANATNSSAVPAALAGSAAFQHLRVNSANNALEWSVLTAGDFPAGAVPLTGLATQAANTIVANATAGVASPTAVSVSADSLLARVGGNLVTHPWSTLAGASLDYAAGVIDYAGTTAEIVNSTATGNLGTIDISSLVCGGTYRVSAASSAYSIEGFTAKSQGFWFTFISEDTADRVTLFNEDATATATNRLALPGQKDATAIQMRMKFGYNGSRWSGLSDNPSAIGTATNFVEVDLTGTPTINVTTTGGAITLTSGSSAAVNINAGGTLAIDAGSEVTVNTGTNDAVRVTSDSGGGFLKLAEDSASDPTVGAGDGMVWVESTTPCRLRFTDDTNVDHSAIPIALVRQDFTTSGTSNDVALNANTTYLRIDTGGSAWTITGFTGGFDGRILHVTTNSNVTGTLSHLTGSAAANRIRCGGSVNATGNRFCATLIYDGDDSLWSVVGVNVL